MTKHLQLCYEHQVYAVCIRRWNVEGEFFIPQTITVYCKNRSGVTKAEMSVALGVGGTCQ